LTFDVLCQGLDAVIRSKEPVSVGLARVKLGDLVLIEGPQVLDDVSVPCGGELEFDLQSLLCSRPFSSNHALKP